MCRVRGELFLSAAGKLQKDHAEYSNTAAIIHIADESLRFEFGHHRRIFARKACVLGDPLECGAFLMAKRFPDFAAFLPRSWFVGEHLRHLLNGGRLLLDLLQMAERCPDQTGMPARDFDEHVPRARTQRKFVAIFEVYDHFRSILLIVWADGEGIV